MAIHAMYPVVDADELELEVNQQFGCNITNIRNLLFYDQYYNDSYMLFDYFDQEEYFDWMDPAEEETIRLRNLVRAYLQDTIPDYEMVLVNVTW